MKSSTNQPSRPQEGAYLKLDLGSTWQEPMLFDMSLEEMLGPRGISPLCIWHSIMAIARIEAADRHLEAVSYQFSEVELHGNA